MALYPQNDQAIIIQAEQELAAAHVTLDLSTIDQLLHPSYTILQPDGRLENKSAVLESYQHSGRNWDSASVSNLEVAVTGNLALATGLWRASGQNGQNTFDYSARFLSMWRKDNGRWQNIAYQSLEIK